MVHRCSTPLCKGIRLITSNCCDRFDWEHQSLKAAASEALHLIETEECAVVGIERDGERIWTYAHNDSGKSCRGLEKLAKGKTRG